MSSCLPSCSCDFSPGRECDPELGNKNKPFLVEVVSRCIMLSQQMSKLGNPLLSRLVFVCLHVTTYTFKFSLQFSTLWSLTLASLNTASGNIEMLCSKTRHRDRAPGLGQFWNSLHWWNQQAEAFSPGGCSHRLGGALGSGNASSLLCWRSLSCELV